MRVFWVFISMSLRKVLQSGSEDQESGPSLTSVPQIHRQVLARLHRQPRLREVNSRYIYLLIMRRQSTNGGFLAETGTQEGREKTAVIHTLHFSKHWVVKVQTLLLLVAQFPLFDLAELLWNT